MTIDELRSAAAVVRDATEEGENTATRIGQLFLDTVNTLCNVSTNAIKGYVVISSTSDLPTSPTTDQQMKGYLLDTTLYVWVGTGGDTLDGKYQSAQLKGEDGKTGPKGDSGVSLGEVVLVNDLTTGGEGNALSAEMGKVLNEKLSEMDGKVDELEGELEDTTYIEYDSLDITKGKYVSCKENEEGDIKDTSTLFQISNRISVKEGDIITYRLNGYNNVICVIAAFDANDIYVKEGSIFYTSSAGSGAQVTFEGEYIVPIGVKYIIIGEYKHSTDSYIHIPIKSSKVEKIETELSNQDVRISNQDSRIEVIEKSLLFDNSHFEEINVCKDGFDSWDYGYIRPNGTIATATSGTYKYSPKIPIKKDSTITIKSIYGNTLVASIASYTQDDMFVEECSYIGASILSSRDEPVVINTEGKSVEYIRITYGGGFGGYEVDAFVGETVIINLHEKIESVEVDYNDKIKQTNERIDSSGIVNPWKGKTWLALGTSITDTNNTLAPDGTCTGKYAPYLKELGEFGTLENKGVAGTIVGSHMLYYASHATHLADADLVTIEGFVNDWVGSRKLGKVGDTIPYHVAWSSPVWDNGGNDETGSFAGAVYQAFTTLMANAPKAKIVLITDNTGQIIPSTGANCARETLKNGLTQKDYTDMAISVAHYLGVEVINAGQESQINQEHPEYLIDQIHQTELGGQQFAKAIWSKLKGIYPIVVE